jgi:formiminoglutamase
MNDLRAATPEEFFFKGRPGDPRIGEWAHRINSPRGIEVKGKETIVIMGCADDQGVVLNRGRAGAEDGPNSIRKHLYKMTPPMDFDWENYIALYDFGNVLAGEDIIATHDRARLLAKEIAANNATIITLGGGHDFAAPTFTGFQEGTEEFSRKKPKLGLINVDPHLDVRKLENERPHSGTPFRQLLETVLDGKKFVEFGTRPSRNSRENFAFCKEHRVRVVPFESIRETAKPVSHSFKAELTRLAPSCTGLGLTVDMDACSDAEGTSAAPVLGFSAWELCQMAALAGAEKKVRFLELAEVAPPLDATERSSRIAAEIIYAFLRARARRLATKGK